MLYAWIDGEKRQPIVKGERATCRDCGGLLTSVIPSQNVKHWRHKAGDCDPWSEPEGPWHLGWKEHFEIDCCEVPLVDQETGEHHRADVLCGQGTDSATVLELQHSPISEEERIARETFYSKDHRMFWLIHVHNGNAFHGYSFGFSLNFEKRPCRADGHDFAIMRWMGRNSQFIEKWKRSKAHVFFDWNDYIYYLAGEALSARLNGGQPLKKGDFALCALSGQTFVEAVRGVKGDPSPA